MEHRTVRCAAAAKMMPFDETGKATPLARADDMHQLVYGKNIDHDLIAGIRSLFTLNGNFASETRRRDIRFFEMTRHRLGDALRLDELDEAELHGIVSILLLRLFLHDDTRACLNDRDRNDSAVSLQQLCH